MGIEFDVSLDEIVALIKMPPLMRKIFNGELVLMPPDKKKFDLLKKNYNDSFKKSFLQEIQLVISNSDIF